MTSLLTGLRYACPSSTLQLSLFLQVSMSYHNTACLWSGLRIIILPSLHTAYVLSKYCFVLEAMLEIVIGFLCLHNFWCGKRKDLLFLATVCKHLVQVTFLRYIASVVFIVTMPELWESLSLHNGLPFCRHTKGSMVAIASWVNRGIRIQSRNGICNRVMYPFYIDNLGSKVL